MRTHRPAITRGHLTIGKHRGESVAAVAATDRGRQYLLWLSSQDWLDDASAREIEAALDIDQPEPGEPDDDDDEVIDARTALPLIVWRWERHMQQAYYGDTDAMTIVECGASYLRELCAETTGRSWPVATDGGAA